MFDALDGTRDDYRLAEELIAQAKAKDATDAEVCAAEAQLHERFLQRGWDTSDARRESARAAVQRAIRLDPQSFEARFAQAFLLGYTGSEGEERTRQMRLLRSERPTDQRILRALGTGLDRLGQMEEAISILDESAALPGGDPLALYTKSQMYWWVGRATEAEAAIEAAIAQKPFTGALLMNVLYKATLHGDLDGARALLNRINPAELVEDRASFFAFTVEWLARRPDAAVARLAVVPRDWLNDPFYRGAKAQLVGDAHQLAGRPDAAALEWRTALKLVDQRLAASPNDWRLLNQRMGLLVRLGQREEAERLLGVLIQLLGEDADATAFVLSRAYTRLGRHAEAISQISTALKREHRAAQFTSASLRLNPEWDPLRGEPAFSAVIAEAEAIEKAAALAATPARDWPKDADLKRAVGLVNGLNSIREDFLLAEEIAKKAVEKSPADPEAVTVLAHVESSILTRNFDFTAERTALARRYSERAVQLAPDDPVALAALAMYLTQRGGDHVRAEELLRRTCALEPAEPRYARYLALVIGRQNGVAGIAAAIQRLEEMVGQFPRDPLVHYELSIRYRDNGRYAESERELDTTIALAPIANAIDWKARFALMRGDLPAVKMWLDRVPVRLQAEERSVLSRVAYALFSGDTAYGLQSLNRFAETWFYDASNYTGPRSLLLGALREREGNQDLARTHYEAALTEIHRYRAEHPADPGTQSAEAWALLGLGRQPEARAANTVALASTVRPFRHYPPGLWWFQSIPRTLLVGDRAVALNQLRDAVEQPYVREPLRLRLEMDPRMAPFRRDPEILAALAGQGAAAIVAVQTAATGPQDPELKRAIKLIDSPEAIASDVALAEDLVQGVLAARPTDAAATVAMGRVQVYYLVRGFDRSEDRFATAKRFAERGLALAPDDPEAMVVMATYLYRRGVELPRATKLLRAAIALRPMEPLYYRMLDNVLSITPNVTDAEVIASAKVTAEHFPQDALVQYELARHYRDAGLLEEAERYLDVAIKLGPVANAITARARLMLLAHGDPAGMKALLDQLPERYRGTDRAVFSQFVYALVMKQPELGLEALRSLPEPWMIDFDYTGPTALLAGEMLLLQGKPDLARLRFTEALAELGRHKADLSRNFSTNWLETWLLMRLGRVDEARKRNEVFFPELARPYRIYLGTNWWFNPINQNLLLGEHAKALALMRETVGFQQGRTIIRHAFQLDPRMAPFRDDPEIKALLAEPEGRK